MLKTHPRPTPDAYIRRGERQYALEASRLLLSHNPDAFWRRLIVIALEDVGIADFQLVEDVLVLSTRKTMRLERGGDWHVGSNLVDRLSRALKCRDACDALVIADLHPGLESQRSAFLDLDVHELCSIIASDYAPIGERVLAAWMVAGTAKFPALQIAEKDGSFPSLLQIYRAMGVMPEILNVARLGSTRTSEGHPIALPLIWMLANSSSLVTVQDRPGSKPLLIGGWPAYAYDMHTRIGKSAIALFVKRSAALSRFLQQNVPEEFQRALVHSAIFRLEGEVVDRRMVYPGSADLLGAAEEAHLTYLGTDRQLAFEALAIVGENVDFLNECRLEVTTHGKR